MSTLVIAEKKEVGTAIANAFSKMLGVPIQQKNGVSYIGDFIVTELAGHVMKLTLKNGIKYQKKKIILK